MLHKLIKGEIHNLIENIKNKSKNSFSEKRSIKYTKNRQKKGISSI